MTKQEWLQRCAARFIKKAGVTQEQADMFAEVCYDAQEITTGETYTENPENCAEEDMEEWVRNI